MIIGQSNVKMSGKTHQEKTYTIKKEKLMTNLSTGEKRYLKNDFSLIYGEVNKEDCNFNNYTKQGQIKEELPSLHNQKNTEELTLKQLLSQLRVFIIDFRKKLDDLFQGGYKDEKSLDLTSGTSDIYNLWNVKQYESCTYEEKSTMSFESTGKVITQDGREIEFNMEMCMHYEYSEKTEAFKFGTEMIFSDPLVISLDSNPVGVSDMKWDFDIDGDGKVDNISLLSKGTGFLVFDKNGDGKINDGNEMFGAKTGNGFAELLEFDTDGNGWIDETDEVYDKLSVWTKDDTGSDKMISIRDAKIGAIYLGNAKTEYAMKSSVDNSQNAQLRRSGMYLTEDGQARSVAQLDMVKALIN